MLPLRFDFIALGIIELHARRLREAEDVDIRNAVRLAGVDCGEHLVGGPARIGLAIGHAMEIGRQHAAEPAAENRYDDVALRGFWYLRLEGLVRLVELGLPADRHDMYDALELAVEPLGHPLQPAALESRIPRRGHEHAHLSHAVCHALPPWKAAVVSAGIRLAEETQTAPSPGQAKQKSCPSASVARFLAERMSTLVAGSTGRRNTRVTLTKRSPNRLQDSRLPAMPKLRFLGRS